MTTVDHAAEARRVLGNIPHDCIRGNEDALAWAQVHATLALVNEQRIANVLEYLYHAEGDEYERLHGDIKKGLGL